MQIVIYNYETSTKELELAYPLAPIQSEFKTFGLMADRPNLHSLVDVVLKQPTTVVVANLAELGKSWNDIRDRIELVTSRGHTVRVHDKQLDFSSVEKFDRFFEDVVVLAPSKPKRSVGKPPRVAPDQLDQRIALLHARKLSTHEIAHELKTSQSTVSRRLRRLNLPRTG